MAMVWFTGHICLHIWCYGSTLYVLSLAWSYYIQGCTSCKRVYVDL